MTGDAVEGFALSPQQERLWHLRDAAEPSVWTARVTAVVRGPLDRRRLERALGEVAARHEILRTTFRRLPGMGVPLQVIGDGAAVGLGEGPPVAVDGEETVLTAALRPAAGDGGETLLDLRLSSLCADATGLSNLLAEVAAAYAGGAGPAGEDPIQYADAAQVFRELVEGDGGEDGRRYWRRLRPAVPEPAPLPLAPEGAAGPFAPRRLELDGSAVPEVTGAATAAGCTPEAFVLAAWLLLLRRLTGRPSLPLGAVFAGRRYAGLEEALGLFARTLPLVLPGIDRELPFADLARRVEAALEEGREHGEAWSWDLAVGADGARPEERFLPYAFEWQEVGGAGGVADGLRLLPREVESVWDRFVLKLTVRSGADRPRFLLEHDGARLPAAEAARTGERLRSLLEAAAAAPRTPCGALPVLAAGERRLLLDELNDTAVPPWPEVRLHRLVTARAERAPDAVAVVCDDRHLTYRRLLGRAGEVARRLSAAGVGPGDRVALCLERSEELPVAVLGTLEAGAVWVPLDPEYPDDRLRFVAADAAVACWVTDGAPPAAAAGAPVVRLDGPGDGDAPAITAPSVAESPAYVIYTSGSTGRPKGVVVPHRAIANRLLWMQRRFPLGDDDRVLMKTPYSFDASIWELLCPLLAGAQVVLAAPGAHRDPVALAAALARHRITRLQLVPSMLGVFLDAPGVAHRSALRRLFCGGEALLAELADRAAERLGVEVCNLYGPTEVAIDASYHPCRPGEEGAGVVSIGRPLDNARVYVLGDDGSPVPLGVEGHLHVAGAGLAHGYLGRPGLTAERFRPDPFSAAPGERLYATGDLARWRPDGRLEFLGRIDDQVKVRGFRIEPGEIEAVLAEHPAVAEAAVVARREESGAQRLVAYAVPRRRHRDDGVSEVELPGGLRVSALNRGEAELIYDEIYRDPTYLRHGVRLPDRAVVFDVGANIGLFSLFVHQHCRRPRVVACEPIPPIFDLLRANLARYGLEVELHECGVGAVPGRVDFTYYPGWSGMSGAYADRAEEEAVTRAVLANRGDLAADEADELIAGRFEGETYPCRVRTLSELFAESEVERVDLLKIDVEKAELDVLDGLAADDWRKVRQVVMEVHDVADGPGGRLAAVVARLEGHGFRVEVEQDPRLVGTDMWNLYAVHRDLPAGAPPPSPPRPLEAVLEADAEGLLGHLAEHLPEYMVPSTVALLDALPRLPSGKVDRGALPAPESLTDRPARVPPRNRREHLLAEVWRNVLGVDEVGVLDNFFELGGDSILSIQVVSRAARAGLEISAQQLFRHQTLEGLAAVAKVAAAAEIAAEVSRREPTGEIPLTPQQRWFFAQDLPARHHFNQTLLFALPAAVETAGLRRALDVLARRHDALRLRFVPSAGGWRQSLAPAAVGAGPAAVVRLDLAGLPPGRHGAAVEAVAAAAQVSLDLSAGPLLRAVHAHLGDDRPGRLLLVAHHLVVDGVSWRLLLADLEAIHEAVAAGLEPDLPAPPLPFWCWAEELAAVAAAGTLDRELPYWNDPRRSDAAPLPVDLGSAGPDDVASADSVTVSLDRRATEDLLRRAGTAYATEVPDLLLAALARTLSRWSGGSRLLIDLEGHGREPLVPGIDPGATVGWLTALYPLFLDVGGAAGSAALIKTVKEQVRAVPSNGAGYGVLRWLGDAGGELTELPAAQVSFNYLGQLDRALGTDSPFTPAAESTGSNQDPRQPRPYLLDVLARVADGRLTVTWVYGRHRYRRRTVERLAEGFRDTLGRLVTHCTEPGVRGYTPSDFPLAALPQRALDRLAAADPEVEDLYPLSPLQHGLLFHSLDAAGARLYFRQLACVLEGPLDRGAFEAAWRQLAARHPILRTYVLWEELEEPVQVVRSRVAVPLAHLDWRRLDAEERRRRWQALLAADREQQIDVTRPPLMRLSLARTGEGRHRLLWSFHHIISDGWSFPLLVEELFQLYEAAVGGTAVELPRPRPYRDYIAWLADRDMAAAEAFWRHELAGFAAPTALAADRPRGGGRDGTLGAEPYDEHLVHLSPRLSAALAELARLGGVTLNTVVQGAWAVLLSRFSGERDVVFGAVTSGRPGDLEGVETMVGVFINSLPVRADVDPRAGLLPWLRRLQERQAEARRHEHTPLAKVQGWSEVPRGEDLFESLMAFENYPVERLAEASERSLSISEVSFVERTNYPLTLVTGPGERVGIKAMYDRRRFDSTTVQRRLRHLATLLAGCVDGPEAPLASLPLLDAAARHQVLRGWNDTAAAYDREARIHDLFAARAAERPDAVAVVDDEGSLTYREVAAAAHRTARHLASLGVERGDRVAVFLERRRDLVPALLGIFQAGAAYVPVESTFPHRRAAWILDSLGITTAVAHGGRLRHLAAAAVGGLRRVVCLDREVAAEERRALAAAGLTLTTGDDLATTPAVPLDRPVSADDVAYVIFTSGSTGTPKGVVEQHRPVVNLVRWVNRRFAVGPRDRSLFVTSLSFDLSVYDVFGLLGAGGSVRVVSQADVRDPGRLVELLADEPVTFWDSAPAALQQLVPFLAPASHRLAGAALRLVFLSGDWIPLALPDRVREAAPSARVVALGGATEATVWSNHHVVGEVDPDWPSIPYGRPIANARYHVLDPAFRPLAVGVAGDLYIGGECLALQYAGSPALTAEKFRPDPFGDEPGGRLYRTGDRARYLADGELQFLGRLDHQVKVRGYRIELGEIESVLGEHPTVHDCVVLARPLEGDGEAAAGTPPGERRLVAWVVGRDGDPAPTDDLRRFLAQRLPEYMLPAAFVPLDALPVTANGKLDRAALPSPEPARPELSEEYSAPAGTVEELLAGIWSRVLRVETVGSHDNFFDLGGDSILSIQIVGQAAQAGLKLSPAQLFEHPTVAELAAVVDSGRVITAEQGTVVGEVPLTPVQSWFFERRLPQPERFNQAVMLRVDRPLDGALLRRATAALLEHHDALRLRFETGDRGWRQENAPPGGPVPCIAVDLSALPEGRRSAAVEAVADRLHGSLDLARPPLLRVAAFDLGRDEAGRLLVLAHHLVMDGVSWRIVLEDLERAYADLEAGRAVELPLKSTSYRRAAQRLHAYAASGEAGREEGYWLADARRRSAALPRDLVDGEPAPEDNLVVDAHTLGAVLEPAETAALLQEVPRAYHTQINDVLLTALAAACRRWTGSRALLVELESHGRQELFDDVDLSRTVGWFTTLFPVLLELPVGDDPGAALRAVKEQLRRVPSHGVGYGVLRHLASPEVRRRVREMPSPDVSFNYLGQLDQALPEGSPFRPASESSGRAQGLGQSRSHLLEVTANVADGRLRTAWSYGSRIHRRRTVERLAEDFLGELRRLIAHCREAAGSYTPSDFPLLGEVGQEQLDDILSQVSKVREREG